MSPSAPVGRARRTPLAGLLLLAGILFAGTFPPSASCGESVHECACCGRGECACGPDASCGCRPQLQSAGDGGSLPLAVVPPLGLRSPFLAPPARGLAPSGVRVFRVGFLLDGPTAPPPKRTAADLG